MFVLSRKSDYGLLLLTLLARNLPVGRQGKTEYIPLSEISKKSGLPRAFVSRIAAELCGAGIINSKEGVDGGYQLIKKPGNISIAQVTQVLDGPWQPTKCTGDKENCPLEKKCPMANNWQNKLKRKMWEIMDSYTIEDLMK